MYTYRHQVAVDAHRRDETREKAASGFWMAAHCSTHNDNNHIFYSLG